MADRILSFEFEELPTVIVDGFEAGLVAGSAEISYDRDGLWSIASISLDGSRRAHYSLEERVAHELRQARLHETLRRPLPPYLRKSVALDAANPLYALITDALEGVWADKVQDAIRDDITEQRVAVADFMADQRRFALSSLAMLDGETM
jgi:hypothetical protein